MTASKNSNVIMLPSDHERRQIFHWLQRISSYTAWHRILEPYKAWTAVIQSSFSLADAQGRANETSLPESRYVITLKGLAHFEKGLSRLKSGDKRVFKFDANGDFEMAGRTIFHWTEMLNRIESGDNGVKRNTPMWPQFCEALLTLGETWGECGPHILEPRYLEEPGRTNYGDWLKNELTLMSFPNYLDPAPDPTNNVFTRTNELTPFSGIWEPVQTAQTSGSVIRELFTRVPQPQPPFKIAGAMNYLHGGSAAPKISVETSTDNIDLDATWRLLWKDNRYETGSIPELEAQYRFNKPRKVKSRPAFWVTGELPWADSGDRAPTGGDWRLLTNPKVIVTVPTGDELPLYRGEHARWALVEK